MCAIVVVVFAVAEFTQGAWVVVVVMPLLVYALVTMNREYRAEDAVLEEGAAVEACEAKVLRRHVVMVLVDRIDLATARAIQYARTLTPDDLHAVHFNIDHNRTDALIERWQRVGLSRLPLDVIDCPDRRLGRAALELAAEQADGETEVSMVLPRRSYGKTWRRILHDQTADHIVEIVSQLPHVNATIIPFHVSAGLQESTVELERLLLPDVERDPASGHRGAQEGGWPAQLLSRARHATDRLFAMAYAGTCRRPGQDDPRAATVRGADDRVRGRRRQRRGHHVRVPRSPLHRRPPERDTDGRGRDGRQAQGQARHDQSLLRGVRPLVLGGGRMKTGRAPSRGRLRASLSGPAFQWALAIVAPVAVALLLIPGRSHFDSADDALVLVVVTVAIASTGSRMRAFVAALVAAASFDFLLTRPYGSFRISRSADVTTEVLFVVVGLLVGELAARGRRDRLAAALGRHEIARLHDLSQRIAEGEDPDFVLIAVAGELRELLSLQDCRFVREQPSGKGAWIAADGTVRLNPLRWPAATVGLPTQHVELPVRGGGQVMGTFILTPTPSTPISHEQCMVAVALADQLGATMATQDTGG